MNYQEAMDFLEETKKYGSQLGLTSITNLMDTLGNVQEKVPVVHIAGTNGKGSTGAMLASVLRESGYKTGHFSTPDVFSYEEEFRINGTPIEKERLAELFTEVAEGCSKMVKRGLPHPTRFEVETAAAFLWFYEESCDIAVIEVGMGGETDATNLIRKPLLSILTSVSIDHIGFLGNTLTEIATVKAGIIKENCPVVCIRQSEDVMNVVKNRAEQKHSMLDIADIREAENIRASENGMRFDLHLGKCVTKNGEISERKENILKKENVQLDKIWKDVETGLCGSFQVENTLNVLHALCILQPRYPKVTEETIRRGLKSVSWPGRFWKIGSKPDFYMDGAHNEGAAIRLRETADLCLKDKRVVYIMGVLADKAYDKIIQHMFRPGDLVYTVTPDNPRALDGRQLQRVLAEYGIQGSFCETMEEAVASAIKQAGETGAVLAFGSLSYLKDLKAASERFREKECD